MKQIFGADSEESAVEESGPRWRIQLQDEVESQKPADDPYEWMNPCDRWMIGKPADKECWRYLDRMVSTRERNARAVVPLYVASILPPPLNLILLLWGFFEWVRR